MDIIQAYSNTIFDTRVLPFVTKPLFFVMLFDSAKEDRMKIILFGNRYNKNTSRGSNIASEKITQNSEEVKEKIEYKTITSPNLEIECCLSNDKIIKKIEYSNEGINVYTYTYLPSGHLQYVYRNNTLVEEYHYNTKGQRICDRIEMLSNRPRDFLYNGRGELIESDGIEYEYVQGKLSRIIEGNQEVLFHYGKDTLLDSIHMPNGDEITYEYEGININRKYKNGILVEEYLWENPLCLQVYIDYTTNSYYEFIYGEYRIPDAIRVKGKLAIMFSGNNEMLLSCGYDTIGTIKRLYNEYGALVKCIDYDSFGNVLFENKREFFLPLGFACGLRDRDTTFIRYCYRDYYPYIGRFTCLDAIREYGTDGDYYDYCSDDPVNNFAPLGLMSTLVSYWDSKDAEERDAIKKGIVRDVTLYGIKRGIKYVSHMHPLLKVIGNSPRIERGVDYLFDSNRYPHSLLKNVQGLISDSWNSALTNYEKTGTRKYYICI